MLRPAASAVTLAAAMLVFCAAGATAANPAPNPPGSASVQPTSVSTSNGTSVSTGQAGASSDGQNGTVSHCGVQAGTASTGYSAQPASAGTSGAGTPTCNASSGSAGAGNSAPSTSYGQGAAAGQTGSSGSTSTAFGNGDGQATKQRLLTSFLSGDGSFIPGDGGWDWLTGLIWLGLLLLLALFFVLIGIALGRRRRAPAAA